MIDASENKKARHDIGLLFRVSLYRLLFAQPVEGEHDSVCAFLMDAVATLNEDAFEVGAMASRGRGVSVAIHEPRLRDIGVNEQREVFPVGKHRVAVSEPAGVARGRGEWPAVFEQVACLHHGDLAHG